MNYFQIRWVRILQAILSEISTQIRYYFKELLNKRNRQWCITNLDLVQADLFAVHLTQSAHYAVDVVKLDKCVWQRVALVFDLNVLTTTRPQQTDYRFTSHQHHWHVSVSFVSRTTSSAIAQIALYAWNSQSSSIFWSADRIIKCAAKTHYCEAKQTLYAKLC